MIAPASRKIGKYEILRKLGRGGMADVYLAEDTALHHRVALKLIEHSPDHDTRDAIEAERRGSSLQAHLAAIDPHVARIYDSGDADGFFFVAMEYVDGEDLSELLRRGPLSPPNAVDVARAVAETLDHAHTLEIAIDGKDFQGIVHGDIKPKNIRIDTRGQVRVLDFGIAKALSMSRRLTRNEFGSVPYGSPERLESGQVNVLSDLWSLAVMLYEMLTGVQPYRADSTERLERMIRLREPLPPVPESVPDPLRRILLKAMAPDPAIRYQTARDFDDDLAAFRNGTPVRAVSEDLDATRRTAPPEAGDETRRTVAAGDGDETRRTAPDEDETRRVAGLDAAAWNEQARRGPATIHLSETKPEPGKPQSWPPRAPKPPRKPWPAWLWKVVAATPLLVFLATPWSLFSSWLLYRRGLQFARSIESEQVTDPAEIWTKWTELSGDNPSSWLLSAPRKAVKGKLVAAATHVIDTYRTTDTAVYETAWKGARDELAHALALDPDNTVRGELRVCEGHLARINGMSHKSPSELNNAVEKFQEAEKLIPHSPDPELGLARVYVYGLKDIDKAYQALEQAQQRGYTLGNREKSQLADGYRDRADRLFWDTRNIRGMPQEKDEVQRSKDDYERALGLYQSIAPWGNANASIARVQSSLESVNTRLEQIDQEEHRGPIGTVGRIIPELVKPLLDKILKESKDKKDN